MAVIIRDALNQEFDDVVSLSVEAYCEYSHALTLDNWKKMQTSLSRVAEIAKPGRLIVAQRDQELVGSEVQRQREERKRSNTSAGMNKLASFSLNRSGYLAKLLKPEDAAVLQSLYEQCTEFALLTDGQPPSSTAARDEFDAVPGGKTTQDKYIFGLFDPQNDLIGMIESIRHYPDNQTWWLGLMMLSPKQRGQGLGSEFYQAFENWVSAQGVKQVSLSVVEANELGLQFWKSLGFEVIRKTEPQQFGNKIHAVYVMSHSVAATA
jgi:GNAT superfamily N-acetyltransferase